MTYAWTREMILANLKAYAERTREPIRWADYQHSPGAVPHYWLRTQFGSWTEALVAAGFRDQVKRPSNTKMPANEAPFRSPYRPSDKKQRTCLRCDQVFESRWSGNRFCQPCVKSKEYYAALIAAGFEECA